MKKVLLIVPLSTLNWGTENAGGVDSVCQMLVKYIAERYEGGFYYRILAFDPSSKYPYTGEVLKLSSFVEVVISPVKETRFGFRVPGIVSQLLRVNSQLKSFEPDFVHAHLASWLVGVSKKCTRVATLHAYKWFGRKPVSKSNDFFYTKVMPLITSRYIDSYTCVGIELKNEIEKDIKKGVVVIGNPIDERYFNGGSEKRPISEKLTIVTCSLITRRKRIDRAIILLSEVIKSGREATLRILGPNLDEKYFIELEQQIKLLGLVKEIVFVGGLCMNGIIEEYKRADIAVFFSEQETFGLVPLEMLAAGLPLITTEVGVLSEYKRDFEKFGVMYFDGDYVKQAKIIAYLDNYRSEEVIEWMQLKFSCAGVVNEYEKLYKEIKRV